MNRIDDGSRIASIAALAAGVRCLAWWRTAAIFNDGPVFLGLARLMDAGAWEAALAHPYHPLYPLATLGAKWAFGFLDWEGAAAAVSIASGAAATALLFLLFRDLFDRRAATIGALIFAFHPLGVRFCADIQSDGLYLVLFVAAVWLLWRALCSGRARLAAASGALAGLAYLTRPEGVGVALVGLGCAALLVFSKRWTARRGVAFGAGLAASALLVMAPYLVSLHQQTGRWVLTQKKSVAKLAGVEARPAPPTPPGSPAPPVSRMPAVSPLPPVSSPPPVPPALRAKPPSPVEPALLAETPFLETVVHGPGAVSGLPEVGAMRAGAAQAAREFSEALVSALRAELLPLLLLGGFAARRTAGRRELFLAALLLPYTALLGALAWHAGYVSTRHAFPLAVLLLGYMALGVPVAGGLLAAGALRAVGAARRPPAWLATALGVALLLGITAPRALKARRVERLAERRAAEWLREQGLARGAVAATKQRVAYYAGAPYVALPEPGSALLVSQLRTAGARHLIIDEGRLREDPALLAATREGMRLVHRGRGGGRSAAVFAIGDN